MPSKIKKLNLHGKAPNYLQDSLHFEVLTGSIAYGVSGPSSDIDISGFCIPPKDVIFPKYSPRYIPGFSTPLNTFNQWQSEISQDKKEYDITIYSITKFFYLLTDNNPNIIDIAFSPERCILYSTSIGDMFRENRKMFSS